MDSQYRAGKVFEYHERTKHAPHRYARSPAYLDWENEPSPFRFYEGAGILSLPFIGKDGEASCFSLYDRRGNSFHPFTVPHIGAFLELSVGLSAWKSYRGSSWVLRINPSSGNLHPTEVHLVLPSLDENRVPGGVFHYSPFYHALERRATVGDAIWSPLKVHFGTDGFLVSLSSIYWRESWKYGERAFRYCNHDVGHAIACLSFSANLLGWKVVYLNALADEQIETMLGFDKTSWKPHEREHADILCFVCEAAEESLPRDIPVGIINSFSSLPFSGEPNLLSGEHVAWDLIEEVSSATARPVTRPQVYSYSAHEYAEKEITRMQAAQVIRQRRSAQTFDGRTRISREHFFSILDKTIPRRHRAPFDVELGDISVHLLIFVHRVTGLEPGLYLLFRDEGSFTGVKAQCRQSFLWKRVEEAPQTLPLYLLREGDFRAEARTISCHQEIAADGVFSMGMIADFRGNVEPSPFLYRRLFWETGMIGQVLYLEAEAHGVRGTGIGCFFDDLDHELLGLQDNTYQVLYHFTVGGPVEDRRLSTLPPYHHLKDKGSAL